MARPVTLFTGQWADLPLETLAEKAASFGYDGLELACWGDHFEVDKALSQDGYIQSRHDILEKNGLKCYAISNHLVGQCVADAIIDERHKDLLSKRLWGDGDPEGVRQRAAEEIKNTARAAKEMGVEVVPGFTGSPVWHLLYRFPPTTDEMVDAGYREFADRWNPILDVFDEVGVKFALEAHPAEIAYDIYTAQKTLEALDYRPAFGFNFDPSHFIHQLFDPVAFINEFADRIYHVHVKDSKVRLNGHSSILGSHLNFGDYRRGWDFVSPGHGDLDMDALVRALNRINYTGPLSVEWEDSGMDREFGATEAAAFVKKNDFTASTTAFDSAFASDD
ncbi:sugar phosphate isomerase/epimerase [Phototrophicus methaneseepsis]|uniref:Sugar phosphate isomerase/epimerase n=1 Tax=Phototrophicus methaneseepsis TaxID=2710758 RepID=A0A7S8E792_9CHLR|nr:sugar phosphate isomerase/epimerase family protein [Phototrophicus methaneseepsis]QPC81654.1 sugar phosphate isomerase/epimerase [Phototrophicus methaneseepsis]